jgi:3-oxoacyl-[acyl-carrier-protein] synthase-3
VEIIGTGIALPRRSYSNQELIDRYDLTALNGTTAEMIDELTGIETRYLSGRNETLGDLGTLSVINALENSGLPKGAKVGKLFLGTATGHTGRLIGGTHMEIQDRVTQEGWPVLDSTEGDRACASWTEQLIHAYGYMKLGWIDIAAVTGAETLSKAVNFKDRSTGIVFGDGAGTAILRKMSRREIAEYKKDGRPLPGLLGLHMSSDGSKREQIYQRTTRGSKMNMANNQDLYIDSRDALVEGSKEALKDAKLRLDDIDVVVTHGANLRLIHKAVKRLGVPLDKVVVTVDKYGNNSSASKPMAIHQALQEGQIKPGSNVLIADVGGGLSTIAAVIRA